jgi:hypothetical protein
MKLKYFIMTTTVILPPDEKEKFSTPLDANLIRTGSLADGACFFYSMNLAFRDFRDASVAEKKDFIENQRKTLADELVMEDWFGINKGHFCFLQILYTLRNCIFVLHYLASGNAKEADKERWMADWGDIVGDDTFDIWVRFFPVQKVDNDLLNKWHNEISNAPVISPELLVTSLRNVCSSHMDEVLEKWKGDTLTEQEKVSIKNGMYGFWEKLLQRCISKALYLQKLRVGTYNTWADMDTILSTTPYLPYDVIFIHAESKEVYFDTMSMSQKPLPTETEREVVVLLYYPDCHFENIGRIISNEEGKQKIIRMFSNKDEFIKKLREKKQ